jgi:hypothetical protein
VKGVVDSLHEAGRETDKTMGFLSAPIQSSYACELYPNAADQEALATEVIGAIEGSPLGW